MKHETKLITMFAYFFIGFTALMYMATCDTIVWVSGSLIVVLLPVLLIAGKSKKELERLGFDD